MRSTTYHGYDIFTEFEAVLTALLPRLQSQDRSTLSPASSKRLQIPRNVSNVDQQRFSVNNQHGEIQDDEFSDPEIDGLFSRDPSRPESMSTAYRQWLERQNVANRELDQEALAYSQTGDFLRHSFRRLFESFLMPPSIFGREDYFCGEDNHEVVNYMLLLKIDA